MDYVLSIALFAIATSVTPGPNNIMVMTSGLNYGVRNSLPLLSGICIGFAVMLVLVGLGFGQLFTVFPQLSVLIKIAGTMYLLYLAWLIASTSSVPNEQSTDKPFGFYKGALFQWVNAKAWVVAIGAISAFTTAGDQYATENLTIALVFLLMSFPCVGVWLMFGSLLRRTLKSNTGLKWFNRSMSLLLVVSVLPVIRDIWNQFQG